MTDTTPRFGRRQVLGCAALFGVAGPLLVACGSDDPGRTTGPAPTPAADDPATPEGSGKGQGSQGLIAAAEVPVGGGVVLTAAGLVVTQPAEGEFKAFSSTCTHQGAQLSAVSNGNILCPLHGSQFSAEDGSNVVGPSGTEAGSVADLDEIAVELVDGQVVRAGP